VNKYLPLILLAAVFVGLFLVNRRNRQRAASADAARREKIRPGSEVMTTSGLYGTVVSMNADDTVLLSIAPEVEVRWALAALREMTELPDRYRGTPTAEPAPQSPDEPGGTFR
jgi:preprotein translocase subunit YajC